MGKVINIFEEAYSRRVRGDYLAVSERDHLDTLINQARLYAAKLERAKRRKESKKRASRKTS